MKQAYAKLVTTNLAARKTIMVLMAPVVYPYAIGCAIVQGVKNVWSEVVDCAFSVRNTVRDVNKFYKTELARTTLEPAQPQETVW